MRKTTVVSCLTLTILLILILSYPFTPIQNRTVNVTDVIFMNSGIVVWGYWDGSNIEEGRGLFTSGFSYSDIGHTFRLSFREYPDPDITCLKLISKEDNK